MVAPTESPHIWTGTDSKLPFESSSFHCIEADPPWRYRDRGYNGFSSVQRYRIHCPYETLSTAEICDMAGEVRRVAHSNCHLWLWTTKDFLPDAFEVMQSWGFLYKQIFTWVKTNKDGTPAYGMGRWGRNAAEWLLFGTTSRSFPLLDATTLSNVFFERRTKHSAKPDSVYEMMARHSPGPRLSLFQRTPRKGFTGWGAEYV